MSDELQVSASIVSAIEGMLDHQHTIKKEGPLCEDVATDTRAVLKQKLKLGEISGKSYIQWNDDGGSLRVNVIDFLTERKVKATDPETGEVVVVESAKIPDGSWRLLY